MIPGARLVLLGRQGAGKGTQCARLSRHYVVPHISTGDMLRAAVREGTEFGRKAEEFMHAGELLPDDIMVGIVDERLERDDTRARGFVLDGFPRTIEQAGALDVLLGAQPVELVIELVVGSGTAHQRLRSRGRADDVTDAVARRVDDFEQRTAPVVDWYRSRAEVWSIDGERDEHEVARDLLDRAAAWNSRRRRG